MEEQALIRTESLPTLDQALKFTRDHNWAVNVEIKRTPPPMESFPVVERVLDLVKKLDMVEQVLLSSFVPAYLKSARSISPDVATAVLVNRPIEDPVRLLNQMGSQIYHPHHKRVDRKQISTVRQAGFEVNVWTVNDPDEMRQFIEAGATGIITDFPQQLSDILKEGQGQVG